MGRIMKVGAILLFVVGLASCYVGPGYYGGGHCWQNWRGVTHCN